MAIHLFRRISHGFHGLHEFYPTRLKSVQSAQSAANLLIESLDFPSSVHGYNEFGNRFGNGAFRQEAVSTNFKSLREFPRFDQMGTFLKESTNALRPRRCFALAARTGGDTDSPCDLATGSSWEEQLGLCVY